MSTSQSAMPSPHSNSSPHAPSNPSLSQRKTSPSLWPLLILAAGFLLRIIPAWLFFLNPDEALHQFLADQPTLRLAYKAALTNSHPPLLILVLYYCRALSHSEVFLRLPSVLAGTACCWFLYQWLKLVAGRRSAGFALLLSSFSPAMAALSSEIRQYALLMFFGAACLYLSERALRGNSPALMALFSLSLYGALLVHYSSLLFACVMGLYLLVRLYPYSNHPKLTSTWGFGQAIGAAIGGYFVLTHARSSQQAGMVRGDFETYLRKSIYHAGEINPLAFITGQTLRVFTYLFSHGVVGTLALIAFLAGIIYLLRPISPPRETPRTTGPTPRLLALLLTLPFGITCAAAFAKLYPYGGTRHAAILLIFAISGTSIGLARLPGREGIASLVLMSALVVCNLFPAPPPLIRRRNQNRALMIHAVDSLGQKALPGSLVLADYESGLELGYYACGRGIVQAFPPFESFIASHCGSYTVLTPRPDVWKFYADDLPERLELISERFGIAPGTKIWLFDAGWITDSAPALARDPRVGCALPQPFGDNIFLCQLTVPERSAQNSLPAAHN
jgi:Dolichyl-phosphate-mannose-protein mannosyltransferase